MIPNVLIYAGIVVALVILFLAFNYFQALFHRRSVEKGFQERMRTQKDEHGNTVFVHCPMGSSALAKGEEMKSKIFHPMNTPHQRMNVMGCPHCYPRCEPGVKRICPVCHKEVAQDQSLTARLFNKALGKKHVHVVGCSNCHKPIAQ